MTRQTRNFSHSLLALAAATATGTTAAEHAPLSKAVRPKRNLVNERGAHKAIAKKVRTGKAKRQIARAIDPEAGPRRDAARKERKRLAKEADSCAESSPQPSRSPARRSVKATARVSPGGKHWEVTFGLA